MDVTRPDPGFWRGRRVLVTGHTGFKGAWLCLILERLGAQPIGLALPPEPGPSAFAAFFSAPSTLDHHIVDVRHADRLAATVRAARPEHVFHLAAQALVLRGYRDPVGTFATNLSGTVHLLEALRGLAGVQAAVIVTTDKVYRNDGPNGGQARPFAEDDPLGGADPYSASKAAAEIAAASWRASFADLPPLATARAGNVIGGGDIAEDRLVPDIVRAQEAGRALVVRHPDATRPWQHVVDVLTGYLLLAEALAKRPKEVPAALNFGPADGAVSVRAMIERFAAASGRPVDWHPAEAATAPEAPRLSLDPRLAERVLGWRTRLDGARAVGLTAAWHAAQRRGEDLRCHALAAVEEAWG